MAQGEGSGPLASWDMTERGPKSPGSWLEHPQGPATAEGDRGNWCWEGQGCLQLWDQHSCPAAASWAAGCPSCQGAAPGTQGPCATLGACWTHAPSWRGLCSPTGEGQLLSLSFSPSNMADSRAKAPSKTPPKSPGDPTKDKAAKRLSLESEGANEGAAAAPELSALEEAFRRFAVHGDTRATGKDMHGKNWSKLCKDCQVIDGRNVTVTDVDIVFSKIK